jgi:hypothetical protein
MKKYIRLKIVAIALFLVVSLAYAGNVFHADIIDFYKGIVIGNTAQEDVGITFNGNVESFYAAVDDSADDLVIGLGSTVGTYPVVSISDSETNVPTATIKGSLAVLGQSGTALTADTVLTLADCGSVQAMGTAGMDLTLPAVTTSGCTIKFFVSAAFATTDMTIVSGTADKIYCSMDVNDSQYEGDGSQPSDQINIVNSAETVGDWVECTSASSLWFCRGQAAGAGGITCTG